MKHVTAILIKFAMIAIILEIVLLIMTNLTFMEVLFISAVVTILAYIVGDLIVLPISNNTVATIVDAGLALFVIYLFNFAWINREITFIDSFIAGIVIGVGEWVFHKYIASHVLPEQNKEKSARS